MNVGICALAKYENEYINDWVKYHIGIGFDHIWLFDNNEQDYPYVGRRIDEDLKDKVTIINYRMHQNLDTTPNVPCYNNFIECWSEGLDWCAFIDIDEFITMDNYTNVKDWLANAPEECEGVVLNWRLFGDDGIVEGDESVPVIDRFKTDISRKFEGVGNSSLPFIYKSIIRCNHRKVCKSPSTFFKPSESEGVDADYPFDIYDCTFTKIGLSNSWVICKTNEDGSFLCDFDYTYSLGVYIRHFITKSLSEFLKYKAKRAHKMDWFLKNEIDYYFIFNERTPEKEAYIRKYMEDNGIESFDF